MNTLPLEHLEKVAAWGGASDGLSYVYRPSTVPELQKIVETARKNGRLIGLRGGGNSYGDAAMNDENILLDMRRMNRILDWNPETGLITLEPGVTLSALWQYVLEDGWWPPVVTGTMMTTIGGCAGMNVHGKNGWQQGPIGDHILSFDMLLTTGKIISCNREQNSTIFYAAIGGFGMLGIFTSITIQMKRVYSGMIDVHFDTRPNLEGMFDFFHENVEKSSYIVGWMDAFAKGKSLGRGDMHSATYLQEGEDPNPQQTMRLENQHLPATLFGVMPKSMIWMFMRPFMNNPGTKMVNMAKYNLGHFSGASTTRTPHAAYHFLLDYVPDWKKAYGSTGLIQYQPFIPRDNALEAFKEILTLCQKRKMPNYLTVLKRHRPDDFLLTHGLDGFSMAMDFRITNRNRDKVAALARELDEIVVAANGRFYLAKDSTLRPETAVAYLGQETVDHFRALKAKCDPDGLIQTNMWRRIFA